METTTTNRTATTTEATTADAPVQLTVSRDPAMVAAIRAGAELHGMTCGDYVHLMIATGIAAEGALRKAVLLSETPAPAPAPPKPPAAPAQESRKGRRDRVRREVVTALTALAGTGKGRPVNTYCGDLRLWKLGLTDATRDEVGGFLAQLAAGRTDAPGVRVASIGAIPTSDKKGREGYAVSLAVVKS